MKKVDLSKASVRERKAAEQEVNIERHSFLVDANVINLVYTNMQQWLLSCKVTEVTLYLKVGLFQLIPSYADFVVELQD